MKKFNFTFALFTVMALFSCGENPVSENNTDTTAASDTTTVKPITYALEKDLWDFVALFDSTSTLPFLVDTALLNHVAKNDTLNGAKVKMLTKNIFAYGLDESTYALKQFYTIDSLKEKGAYAEWCKGLDIGNTKYADAYALHRIYLNAETIVFVWALSSSSYEACPYFSETAIYFTLVYKGNVTETLLTGYLSNAGDPPVSSSQTYTSSLNPDGKINIATESISDEDMDAPKVELTTGSYTFGITNGKFSLINENVNKPKMVKRKK